MLQDKLLSPYDIEILMGYDRGVTNGPSSKTSAKLRELGLIEGSTIVTERGKIFIMMLLNTPLPERRWADPREKT